MTLGKDYNKRGIEYSDRTRLIPDHQAKAAAEQERLNLEINKRLAKEFSDISKRLGKPNLTIPELNHLEIGLQQALDRVRKTKNSKLKVLGQTLIVKAKTIKQKAEVFLFAKPKKKK